jgi:hypothetical protein
MTWLRDLAERRVLVVLVFFLLLNAAFYGFSPADSFLESDSPEYLTPAYDLIATGSFSSEHRLPFYSFVLAGLLMISSHVGALIVAMQAALLFGIGLVSMRIAQILIPSARLPTLMFVCFNPSALFYVQQMLPDILFSFFIILHLYFVLKTIHSGSTRSAVTAGLYAGIATLVRSNGEYVIWLMPLAISVGYLIHQKQRWNVVTWKLAASSLLSALLVTAPYLLYNWQRGEGVSFISQAYKNLTMHENVIIAVAMENGLQRFQGQQIVHDMVRQWEGIDQAQWDTLSVSQKRQTVATHAIDILLQSNVSDLAVAMAKAVIKFFFVNDGQTWAAFWQLPAEERLKPDAGLHTSLSAALSGEPPVSSTTYVWHGITIAFVLVVRVLNVFGVIYLVRRKAWCPLFVFSIYIALFTFITAFMSYSRYRLPVDPLLLILCVWGLFSMLSRSRVPASAGQYLSSGDLRVSGWPSSMGKS